MISFIVFDKFIKIIKLYCFQIPQYATLDDFEQDMLLLFNNACQYNDPDSQIYKDALTLLRQMLLKKKELVPDNQNSFTPNVPVLVQSLLNLLHSNVMEHKVFIRIFNHFI